VCESVAIILFVSNGEKVTSPTVAVLSLDFVTVSAAENVAIPELVSVEDKVFDSVCIIDVDGIAEYD
jgi:hypothetical protein